MHELSASLFHPFHVHHKTPLSDISIFPYEYKCIGRLPNFHVDIGKFPRSIILLGIILLGQLIVKNKSCTEN